MKLLGQIPGPLWGIACATLLLIAPAPANAAVAVSLTINETAVHAGLPLARTELHFTVQVASPFELTSLTASLDGLVVNLDRTKTSFVIDISSLSRGPKTLTVAATDVYATQGVATASLFHDNPPKVHLLQGQINRGPAPIAKATCEDDDPAGCTSLTLYYDDRGPASVHPNYVQVAQGTKQVQGIIPAGRSFRVRAYAVDSTGAATERLNWWYYEPNPHLDLVAQGDGIMTDFDEARLLLYYDAFPDPLEMVVERRDGTMREARADPRPSWAAATLTAKGATWRRELSVSPARSVQIFFENGALEEVASDASEVQGHFLFLNVPGNPGISVWRHSLLTGKTTKSPQWPLGTKFAFAATGDVFAQRTTTIEKWSGSDVTPFAQVPASLDLVASDGEHIALRDQEAKESIYGADGLVQSDVGISLVRPGLFAYTRKASAEAPEQVWLWRKGFEPTQLTFFSASSHLLALGANGEVAFSLTKDVGSVDDGGQFEFPKGVYFTAVGHPPVYGGTTADTNTPKLVPWCDGWYLMEYGALFKFNVATPLPPQCPDPPDPDIVDNDAGAGDAGTGLSDGGMDASLGNPNDSGMVSIGDGSSGQAGGSDDAGRPAMSNKASNDGCSVTFIASARPDRRPPAALLLLGGAALLRRRSQRRNDSGTTRPER